MDETDISFFKDGLRLDGRREDQLRPIKMEVGVLARADGSCYIEMGGNKVIAAVYGPREVHPRHLQDVTRAIVRYRYNMASFSVEERKRPGPDRRSYELSKVSREALEPVILRRRDQDSRDKCSSSGAGRCGNPHEKHDLLLRRGKGGGHNCSGPHEGRGQLRSG